jgi:predicted aspartyl protease
VATVTGAMMLRAEVINPETGKSADVDFRIDTGADVSAICIAVADKIGARPIGFCTVLDADGDPVDTPVFEVDLNIQGCTLNRVKVIGLDLSRSDCAGLIGNNVLNKGVLVKSGESWSFSIGENVCASGLDTRYLLAGVFGLALGVAGTLLLTRK